MIQTIKKAMLTLVAISILFCASPAQTIKATYTYDANGNRVSATLIYLTQNNPSPKIEEEIEVEQGEFFEIKIYPNPTNGCIQLDISGATSEQLALQTNAIKVWDINGRLVIEEKRPSYTNTIDLSSFGNGMYILKLFLKDKVKDFTIIKN